MTNHWIDLKNSDCILIMGSNAAENHPISFKWVTEAQRNGAKVINVDPRFTRTSSKADIYAPLRSGTDIAFLGGMIKYILDNKLHSNQYVTDYTNATFLVNKNFKFENGLFAGYDAKARKYDKATWTYQMDENGVPKRDLTLKDPQCVLNLLKKHYDRYDLKKVSAITGTSEAELLEIYKTYAATGADNKAGTVMYAMGWTQHTVGVQNIRTMSIIQLLLGNMGVAGGGVNALRGESNVQGSTDQALLFHIWPGYLATPTPTWPKLEDYLKRRAQSKDPLSANWWQNEPKYMVSLLKSFFGDAANDTNDYGYNWMGKPDTGKAYSWLDLFDEMFKGSLRGFMAWGMNPACSGANSNKVRKALANLDWMVNVNLFDNETGSFWRGPGMKPEDVGTEVFMLPACVSVEKEGSITNSGRWMQWRYQGPKPMGDSLPDGDIIMELGLKLKELYKEGGVFPDPILNLKWDYMTDHKFDPHKVAKQINGFFTRDTKIGDKEYKKGQQVPSFALLQADGGTSSGNWIYCGSYTDAGNMAARRGQEDAPNKIGLYPGFAWAWPVNRRIIYNRASVNPQGQPYDDKRWVVQWKEGKWVGDIPDGGWPPLVGPDGKADPKSKHPFIMTQHGFGQIFGPGLNDGPFPEHYEAMECPVEKNLMSPQLSSPTAPFYGTTSDKFAATCDPRFPYVCTTYRVSEHWQTGLLTRPQPWLLELQPQVFVEMSEELAELKEIKNGERVIVSTARGTLECTAVVTKRFKPLKIAGTVVHQMGIPYNFGWRWPESGKEESANLLTPSTGDPNTRIPETKTFTANVAKK
jgi:formate dehydrogenase major subunit